MEWVGQVVATLSTEPITNKQLYNNREAFTDADNFGISFPLDLDVKVIPVVTLRMSNIFYIYIALGLTIVRGGVHEASYWVAAPNIPPQ